MDVTSTSVLNAFNIITVNCSMDSETTAIKDFFKQIIMKEA